MAGGWTRDGAVSEQIEASISDGAGAHEGAAHAIGRKPDPLR